MSNGSKGRGTMKNLDGKVNDEIIKVGMIVLLCYMACVVSESG